MSLKPETIEAIKNKFGTKDTLSYLLFIEEFEFVLQHPEILSIEGYHKTEWVSVEDRSVKMPKTDFAVMYEDGSIGRHSDNHPIMLITHWMPLPPSPTKP